MLHKTPVIPEIRIYSPSDNGDRGSSGDEGWPSESHTSRREDRKGHLFEVTSGGDDESSGKSPGASLNIVNGVCYFDFEPSTCVPWQGVFNMRPQNLQAMASLQKGPSISFHKARLGCVTPASRSLEVLREYLQPMINQEIRKVIDKYMDEYFKPGIENVRMNNGDNSVADQHLQAVCRQMLEQAKKMFSIQQVGIRGDRGASPCSDLESGRNSPLLGGELVRRKHFSRRNRTSPNRGYLSDSESDASQLNTLYVPKKKQPNKTKSWSGGSGRSTPASRTSCKSGEIVKREGVRWDPARLTTQTLFVMGARANKALGHGAQRGRLYMKHQDVFRYCGDAEDKLWLYEQNLMPSAGGRAFLLLLDDIKHLAQTDEYRNAPGVQVDDLEGFKVPEFMINKMRSSMLSLRTDISSGGGKKRKHKSPVSDRSHTSSVNIDPGEVKLSTPCASPLPAEEEEVLPGDEGALEQLPPLQLDSSCNLHLLDEPMLHEEAVDEQEIAFIVDI